MNGFLLEAAYFSVECSKGKCATGREHAARVYLAFMLSCTNLSLHVGCTQTMNISNDPGRACAFVCAHTYQSQLVVIKQWTLHLND